MAVIRVSSKKSRCHHFLEFREDNKLFDRIDLLICKIMSSRRKYAEGATCANRAEVISLNMTHVGWM